ncbi:hypothetical protein BWK57_02500, partial [Flavobacterium columnare]|uniref:hypothetical protein n=2 Tax=Flavobacterium TaxID=237 RepID=UPI000D40F567
MFVGVNLHQNEMIYNFWIFPDGKTLKSIPSIRALKLLALNLIYGKSLKLSITYNQKIQMPIFSNSNAHFFTKLQKAL